MRLPKAPRIPTGGSERMYSVQRKGSRKRIPVIVLIASLSLGLTHCSSTYEGAKSAHFDGSRFHNREPVGKSFLTVLKWQMTREKAQWPQQVQHGNFESPPNRVEGEKLRVTFINHATALIQTEGYNILTDPIWSTRCSPVSWAGPKRVHNPGIKIEDLPPIDAVVISHDHYDHLDLPTLRDLEKRFRPLFFAGLGTQTLLKDAGLSRVKDMDWWETYDLKPELKLVFLPAQHWGRRTLTDTNTRLWGSYALLSDAGNIYFAGDTGYSSHFAEIAEKYAPFRFALIPIGAYEPRWFMKNMHLNPADAVQAHLDLKSKLSVGVHFGTFQLTDEAIDEPIHALKRAKIARELPTEAFIALSPGEGIDVP